MLGIRSCASLIAAKGSRPCGLRSQNMGTPTAMGMGILTVMGTLMGTAMGMGIHGWTLMGTATAS